MLFAKAAQMQLPGGSAGSEEAALPPKLGIDPDSGKVQKLGQQQLTRAAIVSFQVALEQYPIPPCGLLQPLCSLHSQYAGMLQQKQGSDAQQSRTQRETLQQCVAKMQEQDCSM